MIDVIKALMGNKYCPWCKEYPFDKFYDRIIDNHRWIAQVDNFIFNKFPIWKLGEKWHKDHHETMA